MVFVRLHIFKFVVDWTRFEVLLVHTMASPVPAVDVEVGGTADAVAHERGDASGARAEGTQAKPTVMGGQHTHENVQSGRS